MNKSIRQACAALLMLGAFGSAVAQVVVTDPWVRATVEGQTSSGAYMTITSDHDLSLVGASSTVAGHVMIHEMRNHNGMMMMMPVERLPLPAGKAVALAPGHYHVMLEGLTRRIRVGDTVPLKLRLLDAHGVEQTVEVNAPVRALATEAAAPMSGMGHE